MLPGHPRSVQTCPLEMDHVGAMKLFRGSPTAARTSGLDEASQAGSWEHTINLVGTPGGRAGRGPSASEEFLLELAFALPR